MTQIIAMLGLFGGLFGGGGQDCSASDAQAQRAIELVERQWPVRSSADPVTGYMNSLGLLLTRIEPIGYQPRVLVLRNLEPMAFALGGGRFVVSDGLVAMVNSESQLAAVLAHELAHQRLQHFCRGESDPGQRIKVGSIVQHFDLRLEIEADLDAVRTLRAGGFDADAMRQVLQCLAEQGVGGSILWERVDVLYGVADAAPGPPPQGDSPGFREARAQIMQDIGGIGGEIEHCR